MTGAPSAPPGAIAGGADAPGRRALVLLTAGTVVLYTLGFLADYGRTPLGRVPLLDAREMVQMAEEIATGTLPHEPFYRAPLYPALLALVLKLGATVESLPHWARLLNAFAHLAATLLVAGLARRLWADARAGLVAGALYGLYPVALHFAGDPLDTSLGIALFLAAIRCAVIESDEDATAAVRVRAALGVALFGSLAVFARPHYLPPLLLWLAVCAWRLARPGVRRAAAAGLALTALLFAGFGLVNQRVGGEFALLPWQGPYNLWKANGPDANGRFFAQSIRIENRGRYVNPTRVESETLYLAETGTASPVDRDAMNRYWTRRTLDHVRAHPGEWLRLMGAKAFYLANDIEQYNNKTYAVHKQRSPWLRRNPLGWGVLLVGAVLAVTWRRPPDRTGARVLLLVALAYAAGALIYFASDRFRLPLAPLAVVAAAGLACAVVARSRAILSLRMGIALVIAAVISFAPLRGIGRDDTAVDDYLLVWRAATEVGAYAEAEVAAQAAIAREPEDPLANEAACLSRFNSILHAFPGSVPHAGDVAAARTWCARAQTDMARIVGAAFAWRSGDRQGAESAWRASVAANRPDTPSALAYLAITGRAADVEIASLSALGDGLAFVARAFLGDAAACQSLTMAYGRDGLERQLGSIGAFFGVMPSPCSTSVTEVEE